MSVTRDPKSLPRPASGDGEILITAGDKEVTLVWEKGNLSRAHLASDPATDMLMDEQMLDISSCECCKRTDGGIRVCHGIPCGSVCE